MTYVFRARPWVEEPELAAGEHWLIPRDEQSAAPPARDALDTLPLTAGQADRIRAALARIDPDVFGDHERPHFSTGVISGSMHYAHSRRHYMPMSARQREMDRLAKPRGTTGLIRSELARAGLLGPARGSGSAGSYWH